MKKNLLLLSVMMVSAIGLTGCGGGSNNNPNVIVLSGSAEAQAFTLAKANEFKATNEAYSKYSFEYRVIGEDAIDTTVTDWTSGPDIYSYASDKIIDLYKAGAMATVPDTYVNAMKTDMGDAPVATGTFAGRTVAYPYDGGNGYFLYYNKRLFPQASTISNIKTLLDACANANVMLGYPLKTAYYGMGLLFSFGADWNFTVDAQGTITSISANFDSDAGKNACQAMVDIMKHSAWQNTQAAPTGQAETVNIGTEDNPNNVSVTLGACIDGTWNAGAYREKMGADYACAKLPEVTVGETTVNMSSFLGYKLYGVNPQKSSNDSDRLGVCHALANYLVSEDVQLDRYAAPGLGSVPTNKAALADPTVATAEHVVAIGAQAQYAHGQGALPGNTWTAPATLATLIEAAAPADIDAAQITQWMTQFNTSIKENR